MIFGWTENLRWPYAAAVLALAVVTGLLAVALPAAAPAPLVLVLAAMAVTSSAGAHADTLRGGALALLLLAVLNGIPGVDLGGRTVPGGAHVQDAAVVLLVGFLIVWREQDGASPPASVTRRWLTVICLSLAGWWAFTLVRTVVVENVPIQKAALLGRDFLYFALVLPLLLRVRLTPPGVRSFLTVVVGGLGVFAFAEIVNSLNIVNLSLLTHSNIEVASGGVIRIYASMNDLVTVGLGFALAAVLLAPEPRLRRQATFVLALCLVSFLLQLTRAAYVGVFVAGVLVVGWWVFKAPVDWRDRLQRRAATAAVSGALILGAALILVPGTADNPAVGAVATRVQSGIQNVNDSSGNVGYRKDVYRTMLGLLGADWPAGLGFLHPDVRYFEDLPSGSIRNADVGVLNVLMTMGAVGSVLLLAGPVLVLARLLEKARRLGRAQTEAAVVAFGAALWLLTVMATSVTLVTLFSVNGLVLTAFVVRVAVAALDDELG